MSAEGARIGAASDLLTPEEAAARLRICAKTLRSIRQRGLIRYVAITKRKIFYRPEDCDAYLASCVKAEVSQAPPARPKGRRSSKLVHSANVVSFSDRRRERLAAKEGG
jgi:hypothetical protein